MDENEIAWEEIIIQLQAFTRSYIKRVSWFSGRKDTTIAGKQADDYVYEAIERYLRNPKGYIASKGTLIKYLKYNLIRGLVSNDLESSENKTSRDLSNIKLHDDELEAYKEKILPYTGALFDQSLDYVKIMSSIEEELRDDRIAENVFFGICNEMDRRDVIKEFSLSEKEYDNAMRRLKTILKHTAHKFNL